MLKKLFQAVLVLLALVLIPAGCSGGAIPGLDWDVEEMVLLEAYTGAVPADARKKETRDPELIRLAASQLKQLKVRREASNDDVPCGGIGLYLRFSRSDGSSETVHLGANGDLLLTGAGFYKLRRPLDPGSLWRSLDGEEVSVPEQELPEVGSRGSTQKQVSAETKAPIQRAVPFLPQEITPQTAARALEPLCTSPAGFSLCSAGIHSGKSLAARLIHP